jgi:hypothetical protein
MGVWNFSIDITTSEGNKLSCHRYHCSIQITEWQVGLHAYLLFLVWHWRLANSCNRHHGEHKIAEVPVGPSVIDRDFKNSSNDFRCSSCRTYPLTKFYSVPFANSVTCSSSHPEVIWSSQGHLVFRNTAMAYKIRTSPTLPESSKKTETENKYVRQMIFDSYLKCVLVDNKVADSDEDNGLHCKEMT